jgi:hypothetical protein
MDEFETSEDGVMVYTLVDYPPSLPDLAGMDEEELDATGDAPNG